MITFKCAGTQPLGKLTGPIRYEPRRVERSLQNLGASLSAAIVGTELGSSKLFK